jgi:prephenate dehydrogenase
LLSVGQVTFGRFVSHRVLILLIKIQSVEARNLGVDFYPSFEMSNFLRDLDVVILSVPMIDLEETIESLPADKLAGKLVVDVSPLNHHPKTVLLQAFGNNPDIDILVTNPMFGPTARGLQASAIISSGMNGSSGGSDVILSPSNAEAIAAATNSLWDGRPIVYERARVANIGRCDRYLKIFEKARCQVVEMGSDQHDATTADAEFVTHMFGRLIDQDMLPPTPVMSKEYEALTEVAESTSGDSFDLFFGMFKYNERAKEHLAAMRENLASLERQLAAREAYLMAKDEMRKSDRQRLLAETRLLLQELARNGIEEYKAPEIIKKDDTKSSTEHQNTSSEVDSEGDILIS